MALITFTSPCHAPAHAVIPLTPSVFLALLLSLSLSPSLSLSLFLSLSLSLALSKSHSVQDVCVHMINETMREWSHQRSRWLRLFATQPPSTARLLPQLPLAKSTKSNLIRTSATHINKTLATFSRSRRHRRCFVLAQTLN